MHHIYSDEMITDLRRYGTDTKAFMMMMQLIRVGQEKPHMCRWPLNMYSSKLDNVTYTILLLHTFRGHT